MGLSYPFKRRQVDFTLSWSTWTYVYLHCVVFLLFSFMIYLVMNLCICFMIIYSCLWFSYVVMFEIWISYISWWSSYDNETSIYDLTILDINLYINCNPIIVVNFVGAIIFIVQVGFLPHLQGRLYLFNFWFPCVPSCHAIHVASC